MRHEETVDLGKTRVDVLSESLQLRMLLFRKGKASFEHRFAAFCSVLSLIRVAPVPHKKLKLKTLYVNALKVIYLGCQIIYFCLYPSL